MTDRSVIVAMSPHEARMLVLVLDDLTSDSWAAAVLEPVRADLMEGLKSLSKIPRLTNGDGWA